MYNILIIAGPSASGKTTVADELLKEKGSSFELVRSLTTRAKRGDAFDSEYIYTTRAEFEHAIKHGGVLEYTEYAGELYGTPRSEMERISKEGKIPLLILDLNGVKTLVNNRDALNPCAVYIYTDFQTLKNRLSQRYLTENTEESKEKFAKRVSQNKKDMENIDEYSSIFYAFIENTHSVSKTADEVKSILGEFLEGKPQDEEKNFELCRKIKETCLL